MRTTEHVIERFALKFEADGLPRIAGRIVGALLLSPAPGTLDDLATTLDVSKGSVSSNARLLERMGVVEKVTYPGDRRDFYRIVDDLHTRMMQFRLAHLQETRDLLAQAMDTPPAREPEVGDRLRTFSAFFAHMHESALDAQRRWSSPNDRNRDAGPTGPAEEK